MTNDIKTVADAIAAIEEDGWNWRLVPKDLHSACKHTGGCAVIKNGGSFD